MSELNYSLYFTLIWWVLIYARVVNNRGREIIGEEVEPLQWEYLFYSSTFLPLIMILLEYLIVR